jgi:hypothetical protein
VSELYLMITCVAILTAWLYTFAQKEKEIHQQREQWMYERAAWKEERQQLLDRIQAPSFDHLKQAEVRVIRAQKEEKKEQPIELV